MTLSRFCFVFSSSSVCFLAYQCVIHHNLLLLYTFENDHIMKFEIIEGLYPELGDRVLSVQHISAPFGLRGTIIAVHYHSSTVEVVFDEPFIGGNALQVRLFNYILIRGAKVMV